MELNCELAEIGRFAPQVWIEVHSIRKSGLYPSDRRLLCEARPPLPAHGWWLEALSTLNAVKLGHNAPSAIVLDQRQDRVKFHARPAIL